MERIVQLPIYGPIDHGPDRQLAWDLYQSDAAARLRNISLSSVPSAFVPNGMATSRFHHSVAVGHLAYLASEQLGLSRENRDILVASSLLHDSGSPPFSHIAEVFMDELTGRHHEAEVQRILETDLSVQHALSKAGVDPRAVYETIVGQRPITGKLLAGTLDLDNIDNSLDLLHSLTGINPLPYQPEQLICAYRLQGDQLYLHTDHLADVLSWAETRHQLYSVLYSSAHLSASASLYRALELAFDDGKLEESFFHLGESTAMAYLADCHAGAGEIIETLSTWHHYPEVIRRSEDLDMEWMRRMAGDWRARCRAADRVAEQLGLERHQVALYIGVDKGDKAIQLPWTGERAQAASQLFTEIPGRGRIALFCQGKHPGLKLKAEVALDVALGEAQPHDSGHTFF